MSSKNSKPYSDSSNRKRSTTTRSSSSKKKNTISNSGNSTRSKSKSNDLEHTTRIRIDRERINDLDSLDTSFLEGRLDKKIKKNNKIKENILKEKKSNIKLIVFGKSFAVLIIFMVLVFVSLTFASKYNPYKISDMDIKKVNNLDKKEEVQIDDNYVFVGGSHTNDLNFDDYDYHYVKVSDKKLFVDDLLKELKAKVYKYNPTVVFLEIGKNDLEDEKEISEIIKSLKKVISEIKNNRPSAKIYLESVYPINDDIDDFDEAVLSDSFNTKKIKEFNTELKNLVDDEKVYYLDLYDVLSDDDELKEDYTEDGINLNDEGKSRVLKEIVKIVG